MHHLLLMGSTWDPDAVPAAHRQPPSQGLLMQRAVCNRPCGAQGATTTCPLQVSMTVLVTRLTAALLAFLTTAMLSLCQAHRCNDLHMQSDTSVEQM